ncbi:MAG: hypothetical protein J5791_01615 [Fibrobacter sp.]|nr:hypothetical protein [Fibrobacter sp.]
MFANLLRFFAVFFIAVNLVGCTAEQKDIIAWGSTEEYDDFLWEKFIPDTLTHTIAFEFNKDAQRYGSAVTLGVFKRNDNGKFVPVDPAELEIFVNGAKQENIRITPDKESVKVGFVLGRAAEAKAQHWYFRVVDMGGMDRINDIEAADLKSDDAVLGEIVVVKKHIWNPVALVLFWILITLLALLLLWFSMGRNQVYPKFRGGSIVIEYGKGAFYKVVKVGGCKKLVCTRGSKPESALSQLFTGKVIYVTDKLGPWVSDVTFEPATRRRIRLRYKTADFIADSNLLNKGEVYNLKSISDGTEIKLTIQ